MRSLYSFVGRWAVMSSFLLLTAMRFAMLEAKVALAKLLLEAELDVPPGHEETAMETANGLLRPKGGLMLLLKKVQEE